MWRGKGFEGGGGELLTTARNNLALCLKGKGAYEEAEALYRGCIRAIPGPTPNQLAPQGFFFVFILGKTAFFFFFVLQIVSRFPANFLCVLDFQHFFFLFFSLNVTGGRGRRGSGGAAGCVAPGHNHLDAQPCRAIPCDWRRGRRA